MAASGGLYNLLHWASGNLSRPTSCFVHSPPEKHRILEENNKEGSRKPTGKGEPMGGSPTKGDEHLLQRHHSAPEIYMLSPAKPKIGISRIKRMFKARRKDS